MENKTQNGVRIEVKDSWCAYMIREVIYRVPRDHAGWQSVTYKGQRYQLFGLVHSPYFINLRHPLKGNLYTKGN